MFEHLSTLVEEEGEEHDNPVADGLYEMLVEHQSASVEVTKTVELYLNDGTTLTVTYEGTDSLDPADFTVSQISMTGRVLNREQDEAIEKVLDAFRVQETIV